MTTTATLPSIAEDVARRVEIKAQMDHLADELTLIDDRLRANAYGTHDAGPWSLTISHNRRLDAERFTQRFDVAQHPHLYKPVPNLDAIKEYLAPVELDQYYNEGSPRIGVR